MAANSKSPVQGDLLVPERLLGVTESKKPIALEPEKRPKGAFLFAAMGRSNNLKYAFLFAAMGRSNK